MRFKNRKYFLFVFILMIGAAVISLQSFRFNSAETDDKKWPGKRELTRKLWQTRKMLRVYGTGNPEFTAAYKKCAEQSIEKNRFIEMIVKPDTAVTAEDIQSIPLSLIGTPNSNLLLRQIVDSLPVQFKNDRFSIEGIISSEPNDVCRLRSYPNPLNPSMPVFVTTGNSDEKIIEFLSDQDQSNLFTAGDFVLFRNGKAVVWGLFKQEENGSPWQIDPTQTRNYLENQETVLETEHYVFDTIGKSTDRDQLKKLAAKKEQWITNLISNLNLAFDSFPKIKTFLYESIEDKGLITRNTDLSHFDLKNWEVHAVFNENLEGSDFYADAKLLIAKYVSDTKSQALRDGLAICFSDEWGKHGYQFWAKKFYDTGNVNPLSEIIDSKIYRRESYLFMRPLSGSFVEFLIQKFGWSKFLELYKSWPESGLPQQLAETTLAELEQDWLSYLGAMQVETWKKISNELSKTPEFQKGFCYAHEGYQIYNGYLSQKSFQSLKKLNSLGNEWISITPFGYLKNATEPDYFRYSFGAGSENDESVITAAYHAKELGMGVMLKPHVLMSGGHWGWPGDVKMQNEADWQKFFKYYTSWIRHYALLAEMHEMDILCIGVELMQTTRDHQKEWREIIAKLRKIYSGQMVYAANWYQEFEQITFWDDLDYIGLNLYYPLSNKDSVTVDDLIKGMHTGIPVIEKVVRRHNKPLLLTEVGFTSTRTPWKTPHERNRGSDVYFEDQALCYQAMFESFWDKEWFYGFYWWKWPTYLEYGGRHHSGFTPNGKPAEKVVGEWYSRKEVPVKPSGNRLQ